MLHAIRYKLKEVLSIREKDQPIIDLLHGFLVIIITDIALHKLNIAYITFYHETYQLLETV